MTRRRSAWVAAAAIGLPLVAIGLAVGVGQFAQATPAQALTAPQFVEEASAAGIDHRYDGEFMFFVGGGVAVFDCDGDGLQDVYLAGGSQPAALYRNVSAQGAALRFTALLDSATDLTDVTGAYPLNVNGDAIPDLAVLRVGENVLLRGTGDCRFERANERWGYEGGTAWTTAFSAKWEGSSAFPTMAFGNYLKVDSVVGQNYDCDDSELVRPAASGTGYAPPAPLSPGYCTLSMLFSDWDRSGRRDLRMSNDRHYYRNGEEQLWRVAAGETPRLWTHEEGWQTVRIWGMGIASQDLTGDGYPEVYLTSQGDNKLVTLAGDPAQPRYDNIGLLRGVTAHRPYQGDTTQRSTGWHAEFQDANNDGYMDLFVAKGNVEAMTEYAARDPSNLLIGQADGTFVEGAPEAGIVSFARARGAALTDFNLDGLLDLIVVNRREAVSLWRNVGSGTPEAPEPMGNWIALRLEDGGAKNRDAIGSWVDVEVGERTISREVTVGGGHAGGQLGWIHFGLGQADRASITVRWPDGEVGPAIEVDANGFAVIERGATEARSWQPGP